MLARSPLSFDNYLAVIVFLDGRRKVVFARNLSYTAHFYRKAAFSGYGEYWIVRNEKLRHQHEENLYVDIVFLRPLMVIEDKFQVFFKE